MLREVNTIMDDFQRVYTEEKAAIDAKVNELEEEFQRRPGAAEGERMLLLEKSFR